MDRFSNVNGGEAAILYSQDSFDAGPNFGEARRFLTLLDPNSNDFLFQGIAESPELKGKAHPEVRFGHFDDLADELWRWNQAGYGVFICANKTVGGRRRNADISAARAIWRELDCEPAFAAPIAPSLIVQTSPGRVHEWFFSPELSLEDFDAVQEEMARMWDSDPCAKDRARVMRLPGFFHRKSAPHLVRIIGGDGRRYGADEILKAFQPTYATKAAPRIQGDLGFAPAALALLASLIDAIPGEGVESRDDWLSFGFALARLGDDWQSDDGDDLRLELWNKLSCKAPGYGPGGTETGCADKWDEILKEAAGPRANGATYRSLVFEAEKAGWTIENSGIPDKLRLDAQSMVLQGCTMAEALGDVSALDALVLSDANEDEAPAAPSSPSAAVHRKMTAEWFDDAADSALAETQRPMVEDLLDDGAMSVFYGDSNVGKSFVALDLAFHVATGRDWNGKRATRGFVVYVAAEGGNRIKRRFAALKRRYCEQMGEAAPKPLLALVRHPIDLRSSEADPKELVELIRSKEREKGYRCAWIIVDTLSRALAGGDENSSVDMGQVVKTADLIRQKTRAHFTYVHHSGKNSARGARGHSLLRAATDTEIEISAGRLEVTKQRDLESGYQIGFKLADMPIGIDQNGAAIKAAVVEWCGIADAPKIEGGAKANAAPAMLTAISIWKIQDRLSVGAWKKNSQADKWAGVVVADVLGLNPIFDKPQIAALLDWLLSSGSLKEVEGKDDHRKRAKLIVPGGGGAVQ